MKMLKNIIASCVLFVLSAISFTLCTGVFLLTGSLDKLVPPTNWYMVGIFIVLGCVAMALLLVTFVVSCITLVDGFQYPWSKESVTWECWKTKTLPEIPVL